MSEAAVMTERDLMMEGKEGKCGRRQSAWETEELLGLAIFLFSPNLGVLLPASIWGRAALVPLCVALIRWLKRDLFKDEMRETQLCH